MPGKIMNTTRILLPNISWIYQVLSILLPLSWSKPPFSLQWTSCHGLPVGLPAWIQQEMISSNCKSGHSDLLYFLMWPARPCNGLAAQWFSISEVFPPRGLWQYLETFLVIPLGHVVGIWWLCCQPSTRHRTELHIKEFSGPKCQSCGGCQPSPSPCPPLILDHSPPDLCFKHGGFLCFTKFPSYLPFSVPRVCYFRWRI